MPAQGRLCGRWLCLYPWLSGSVHDLRVGELSAICGVGGAYAEHAAVIHRVGMLASAVRAAHRLVHHTLGNGQFELFSRMAAPAVCAQAIMTPDDCVAETERLIAPAFYHRRPVYMSFPADYANMPVIRVSSVA